MKRLTKENIDEFLNFYHHLHDSSIARITYDIKNTIIEIEIDIFWSGKPSKNEDGSINSHKTKLKLVCHEIEMCNNKEIFSWDYIDSAYIKYITIKGKEFLYISDKEERPSLYVVCEYAEYEEM